MAFFEWNDRYSVGVKRLDDQHKQLIGILNELFEAMKVGKAQDVLQKTLVQLVNYTKTHFAAEESLLKQYGYPEYERHKQEHDKLAAHAAELLQQLTQGKAAMSHGVADFLKSWLINHIQGNDKKYGPFLNSKGLQ